MATGDKALDSPFPNGPQPGISYPLKVQYCGECSIPLEYCEYGPHPEKCKAWLQEKLPDVFAQLFGSPDAKEESQNNATEAGEQEQKKKSKRGGKGLPKAPKKGAGVEQKISMSRASRGKNKFVTVITGLSTCDVDLKAASKFFSQRFACGSSVTGPDEIVIQGDVKDDLFDVLPEKWPQIDEDAIEDLGDLKR